MDDITRWAPLLLAIGVPLTAFLIFGAQSTPSRLIAAATGLVLAIRYVAWRVAFSMPGGQGLIGDIWAGIFLIFELATMLSAILLSLFMIRTRDRSGDVDARAGSVLLAAPVDVFIATFNEPYEILERTVLGACAIAHGDLRVWVLDDGARDWVRDLAAELGVEYRRRVKGAHAKAGNVNNGLREALATGRKPDFLLLLDADFIAGRSILRRTLPLFEEADIGIVQTPQHFFNPDPMQSNLLCAQCWPDEQRFFFNVLLSCKDAWGAAFCCGTSAVFRIAALEDTQGLATETVTEDMLTSFKMGEHGWRTVFLNERLSLGLAPEGLQQYVSQRARWCLGAIQQVFTRWSFAGCGRIGLINRISSFDGFLYWGAVFPYKLMMFAAPAVFWWTGLSVVDATLGDLVFWLLPYAAVSTIAMVALGRARAVPVLTDVSQLMVAWTITRTVAHALVKPFGHPFRVTAKGVSIDRTTVQWGLMTPLLLIAFFTASGVLINLSPASRFAGTAAYAINLVWSLFNIVVLLVSAMVCVELPQRRTDERFAANEPACLVTASGLRIPCRLRDISVAGARVARSEGFDVVPGAGHLLLDDETLAMPCELVRKIDGDLALNFARDIGARRRLIVKLFTGAYTNEVAEVRLGEVMLSIIGRLFA